MHWGDLEERVINLKNERQVNEVRQFLSNFSLTFTESVDYTVVFYRAGKMIATGSFAGEVLRNIAVDQTLQGEGLTSILISHLMKVASNRGIYHYFIFTKPDKAHLFTSLGFKNVGQAEPYAVLLEAGIGSIDNYCREIAKQAEVLPQGQRAGLVVNCNPFTLGHKAVIDKAAKENQSVVVFVVSEEKSLFPFEVRIRLVKAGLEHHNNVLVLPAGKYLVSAATFPGYFTRGNETVTAQTRLDADIFARHIAPAMGISRRYVGNEPYCEITQCYNQAMTEVLPHHGIEVIEMPRVAVAGEVISASRVRELIREGDWASIKKLVPATTYEYLISDEAVIIIDKIRHSKSRH